MRLPRAMPMLAVMRTRARAASSISNGSRSTSSSRSATNSGLPVGVAALDEHDELVAAEAGDRVALAQGRREPGATAFRSRSPASWPSVSFTCLKPSRSMNSAAVSVPLRRARACICSTRSRIRVRFGSPVSESCSAWWRMLLEQPRVADRDRGLAGDAAQPARARGRRSSDRAGRRRRRPRGRCARRSRRSGSSRPPPRPSSLISIGSTLRCAALSRSQTVTAVSPARGAGIGTSIDRSRTSSVVE